MFRLKEKKCFTFILIELWLGLSSYSGQLETKLFIKQNGQSSESKREENKTTTELTIKATESTFTSTNYPLVQQQSDRIKRARR